ncbi:MAG: cytochrome c oxidase subunit II [Planctomycetes bacterium]|nr:cytochrome c oxidase subunit II [Planctomycetota bacterium]
MAEKKRTATAALLVFFFLGIAVLTVAGFATTSWRPEVASRHGEGVDRVITYLLCATGVIFVLGHGVLAWFVWKFRSAEGPAHAPPGRKVEWAWAIGPALSMAVIAEIGVLFLGMPVWGQIYGETPDDAVLVEVVGKQFEWLVHYPGKDGEFGRTLPEKVNDVRNPIGLDKKDPAAKDDLVFRGRLVLPVSRTASVRLRSHDVLHSFSIPQFRVKQDIVPGMQGHTQFEPTKPGEYEIACAELCGLGHYRMRGIVLVMEPEEFEEWLRKQRGWFE